MDKTNRSDGILETSKHARSMVVLAAGILVLGLGVQCAQSSVEEPTAELVISPEATAPLATASGHAVAISPDGRNIVYMGEHEGEQHLFVYSLEEKSTRLIEGSERVRRGPIFSPDSQSIAFTAGGKLRRVLLSGGVPEIICATPSFWGATWYEDMIVFSGNLDPLTIGIHRVSPSGGTPENLVLADPEKGENAFAFPQVLPGGEAILFSVSSRDGWRTEVVSLDSGRRQTILEDARQAHYLSTGHLVYEKAGTGTLMAAPFDLANLELTGESFPVLDGVRQNLRRGVDYGLSSEGTLVYVPRTRHDQSLVWVDPAGTETTILRKQQSFATPRVSPDGTQVVFSLTEENRQNLWIHDLTTDSLRQLTEGELNTTPSWAPDGESIVFQSNRSGANGLCRQSIDGTGSARSITQPTRMSQVPGAFTPDGSALTYLNRGTVWTLPLPAGEAQKLVDTPLFECCAVVSPDGGWFAHVAGPDNIYVDSFEEPETQRRVSEEGGQQPVWSPTGDELFYRNGDKMMAVSIQTEPVLSVGEPRVLFEGSYRANQRIPQVQNYDISPDGQRFLMIRDDTEPAQIRVVPNWIEGF